MTTVNGTAVKLYVGTKPGPVYIYWHATGTNYTEVDQGMPGASTGVATNGGIVMSFQTTNNINFGVASRQDQVSFRCAHLP